MKKRVFQRLVNDRFEVLLMTEDWSCGDVELMNQFGEPEINVGGPVEYIYDEDGSSSGASMPEIRVKDFPVELVRVRHGFPYSRIFDARDYESFDEAKAVAEAWKVEVLDRIDDAVLELRRKSASFVTEEVTEI